MEPRGEGRETAELVRLSQVDYMMEAGQPDVFGWPVVSTDGEEIGLIDDLLIDTQTGEIPFGSVCYGEKCTVVPVSLMYLDEPNRRVILSVTKADLENAPEFSDQTEDLGPHTDYWGQLEAEAGAEEGAV